MNEQRRQILQMLADHKITTDDAERLIDALGAPRHDPSASKTRPKYLRVVVHSTENTDGDGPGHVNVRVPLRLLRAGIRLTSLIPQQALTHVNAELGKAGVPIDLIDLKPQHIEDLIDHLDDLTVDVDQPDAKVRVFCE